VFRAGDELNSIARIFNRQVNLFFTWRIWRTWRFNTFLGVLFIALLPLLAYAQSDAIPYRWDDGDAALAYPADWLAPVSEINDAAAILTLAASDAEESVTITIERIPLPPTRVFDIMAARLAEAGISVAPPTETQLVDIVALETRGQNNANTRAGIARGTTLDDGSALIVIGVASVDQSNTLLVAYDIITQSLVRGATQLPRIPNGDGSIYARLGSETLTYEQSALGSLSLDAPSQVWTFEGAAGEVVSIFATDINRTETINLRLSLQAADGTEIAANDNHSGVSFYGLFSIYDAAIADAALPADGIYTVLVERVFGEGVYSIGVRRAGSVTYDEAVATRIQGAIDDVFAAQTWLFAARADEVYTITMTAAEGTTLDPALRLFAPDGRVIEQNDDARDTALGLNAQLVQVAIPQEGIYRLEATRFAGEGEGAYEIVIVRTG
jgi:hypothetical protein